MAMVGLAGRILELMLSGPSCEEEGKVYIIHF